MRGPWLSCRTNACQNKTSQSNHAPHSSCLSSVLTWPSNSSSLCSFWHRCLCWARRRNTATLQNSMNKESKLENISGMNIKLRSRTHLLSAAICCSISSSKSFLCSTKLWMFCRQSFSSSLQKQKTKETSQSWYREILPIKSNQRGYFQGWWSASCAEAASLWIFYVAIAVKGW